MNMWLLLMHPLLGTWPTTQSCAQTGNRTGDPLVRRPALNPLSHTSQARIVSYGRFIKVLHQIISTGELNRMHILKVSFEEL